MRHWKKTQSRMQVDWRSCIVLRRASPHEIGNLMRMHGTCNMCRTSRLGGLLSGMIHLFHRLQWSKLVGLWCYPKSIPVHHIIIIHRISILLHIYRVPIYCIHVCIFGLVVIRQSSCFWILKSSCNLFIVARNYYSPFLKWKAPYFYFSQQPVDK